MSVQDPPTIISTRTPSQNLWDKALNTLGVELRNSLDLTKASRIDVLSKALKEAREKKQVCVQKCWTLKKPNGKTIILRDVVEKIIVWVEKFVRVGDAAMQFDPVHAAIAWGTFRFVLQVAVNDKRVFGETIENLEAVSYLITRYAILEEMYLQRNSAARDNLEDMVVCLYAEILTFLGKASKYFRSSAKVRLARSIVTSSDEQMTKIHALDGQILRLTELFSVDIQIDTAKEVAAMNALLTSLNEPFKRLADYSSVSAQDLQESQQVQLLHWLSPVPFSSHHKRHSESRIRGSGQWLLDHDQYFNWRNDSSSSIFLLHGIIGSGKTSLASAVVDSFLQESSGQVSPAPMAYFYCTKNSAETERSNPDEIMRCILRQLTVSHKSSSIIQEGVLQEYERRQAVAKVDGFEIARLKATECMRLILDTTAVNPVTIVVDAVDEIQSDLRHLLLSALIQIVQDSLSVVKVFLTSRDDSNTQLLLSDAVAVRIQTEHTRNDMDEFVHYELSSAIQIRRLLNGVVSENLNQELKSALINGAGEMFIWVVRQINNLCRMKTEADIRSAMRVLPSHTLNELYEEDFSQMSKSGQHARSYATTVFSLLLCSQEALSPQALIQAVAKSVSQQEEILTIDETINICFNQVVLDSELNVLRFAHISFQEFLLTRAEFTPHYVHKIAATSCLEFCLEGLPVGMETDLSPKDNFHHYSAVYWAEHCRITIVNGADDSITSKMQDFVFEGRDTTLGFVDWIQEVDKFTKKLPSDHELIKQLNSVINPSGSPLFTACVFGLTPIIDSLAQVKDYDWNQTSGLGQSGLYLAAATGHRTIVQSLLQHKVYINTFGGKFSYPLHAACFGGHASIVDLLLDHGANPKLGPRSALQYALLAEHENIALLLLEDKFHVSDQAEYSSILQDAAEAGFADVIQFLQKEYGSLYGDLGHSKRRAIEVAIFKGRTGVVERYMQKLSDPGIDMPEDSIATAALGGQDTMICFLVDRGLDLNEEGLLGTPLRAASIMCHESTVRLLLRLGASVHVSGSLGEPLQAAAMRGHEKIIRTLLSHGADVNSKGGLYGTALHAAAHRGHQNVVEILLDAGADVHRDGFSRDAFVTASEGGHEGIVRLLLERGFKGQNHRDFIDFSPRCILAPHRYNILRDASPSRSREVKPTRHHQPKSKDWFERASMIDFSHVIEKVRGAVNSNLEVMQPYREGLGSCGALLAAVANGHVTVVELLLSQLDKLDIPSSEFAAAFKNACENGHVTMVELLLSQLDKLDIPSSEFAAAFKKACENGHEKVVYHLLSDQLEVEKLSDALEAAALNGHLAVVNLLIDHEDRLGLARAKTLRINRRAAKCSNLESSTPETFECDLTSRATLISGSKGGHLPIFGRGQDLVAQRCTDVASRHLFGEALIIAAKNRRVIVVEALLESNSSFDLKQLAEVLNLFCAWESEEAVQMLLKHDGKMVLGIQQYSNGLSHAARKNNRQVVVYWLEKHPERQNLVVDPAIVIDVAGNGFMEILLPLVERIRPKDTFEMTLSQCLQVALKYRHKEVVEYLIGESVDVNAVVKDARYASVRNAFNIHDFFGDGFHVDLFDDVWSLHRHRSKQKEEYNRYPLNVAAAHCPVEVVQKLISSGAHVEAATKEYGTALQAAARREINGLPIINALLEANAPVSSMGQGKAAALSEALSFFATKDTDKNKFSESSSITDVLSTGPGAIVKALLTNLPEERADDPRYGHLAQMACMAGDQDCVELLLQRGLDVNGCGNYYGTALQAASRVGDTEIVERLLDSGANVNILEGAHGTALQAASLVGNIDIVERLLNSGANVNILGGVHGTALQAASYVGNIEIVERLLTSGANVNILEGAQGTALRAAVLGGHEDVVCSLIARGADVNLRFRNDGNDEYTLHLALESGNHAIFKTLLAAETDISTEISNQLLLSVCERGDTTLAELLLAIGVDVNVSGKNSSRSGRWYGKDTTPLNAACAKGHLSVVLLLLHAGADVNNSGYSTPLSEAAEDRKLEIVEELLSAGAIIGGPSTKKNVLAEACRKRQHMVVELLLEALSGTRHEAEVCGEALSAATKGGDCEMVRLLLEHGVPPSFEILRQACSAGILKVVRVLIDTGIDINRDDSEDAPLLHVAASHSRLEVVQFLIDRGASVTLSSTKYGSPLIAALEGSMANFLRAHSQPESCRSLAKQLPLSTDLYDTDVHIKGRWSQEKPGYKEVSQCEQIVRSLLKAGAEIVTTTRNFGNPLHLASYMGSEVIVHQLLERMADVNVFGGYFGSPLIAALKGDHPIIVELLLDREIDVNWSSPEHGFALHYACAHGSKKLIQSLLDHGADINAYDEKHGSALAAAVSPSRDIRPNRDIRSRPRRDNQSSVEQRAKIEFLLSHEPKVQIRECDLLAASSWTGPRGPNDGDHFMSLFLKHDQSAVATELVIVKAIQNYSCGLETLSLLLRHDGGFGTTPAMLKAVRSVEVMRVLLKHKPVCQVTADILASASSSYELFKLLLTHDPELPITEATVIAVMKTRLGFLRSSNESFLKLLLDRNRDLKVTDDMLENICYKDDMEMILQRWSKEQTISPKVLEKAAESPFREALVLQLMKHDNSVKIMPLVFHSVVSASDTTESCMRTLLEHDSTLDITQDDLMSLVKRWGLEVRKIINVLVEYGKTVEFTAEVTKILDEKFQSQSDQEMKELLYRLKK